MRRRTQSAAWMAIAIGAITLAAIASKRATATVRPARPARDYSSRTGFPLGVEASRGAGRDALIPADMLTPDPLRPFTDTRVEVTR